MYKLAGLYYDVGQRERALVLWSECVGRSKGKYVIEAPLSEIKQRLSFDPIAGRQQEAIALCELILSGNPDDFSTNYSLGWYLATCADPAYRDPGRAVELAKSGASTSSGIPIKKDTGRRTLSAGDWRAQLPLLKRNASIMAVIASTGFSWPWPIDKPARRTRPAAGSIRRFSGCRRSLPRTRNFSASVPKRRSYWEFPISRHQQRKNCNRIRQPTEKWARRPFVSHAPVSTKAAGEA